MATLEDKLLCQDGTFILNQDGSYILLNYQISARHVRGEVILVRDKV